MKTLAEAIEKGRTIFATRPYHEAADEVHHLLIEAGMSEADAFRFNAAARERYPVPTAAFRTFEIFVTRWCNLDCSYCFVHSKTHQLMTDEIAAHAIEFIVENRDPKASLNIVFMGGEPTSRFELIRRMTLAIESRISADQPLRFDITSNGTLLTEEMMEFFSTHRTHILLSVDGGRETHDAHRILNGGGGTFDLVVKKLQIVRKYQPYLGTKMTPTPETVVRLADDVQELVGLGFCKIIVGPATGVDWTPSQLGELEAQLTAVLHYKDELRAKGLLHVDIDVGEEETVSCDSTNRWGCRAGRTGIAIDYDGTLSPCSKIIGTGNPSGGILQLGKVESGITEHETHQKLNGIIPTTRTGCRSCGLNSVCLGGCYAANFEATGDPYTPAPVGCSVVETVLKAKKRHDPKSSWPTSR